MGVLYTDNSVFLSFLNINDRGRLKVYYNVPITKSTRILVIVILVSLCQKDINRPFPDDVIAKCLNIDIFSNAHALGGAASTWSLGCGSISSYSYSASLSSVQSCFLF